MDVEQVYGVNAERSICVVRLTKTDSDADIIASFKTYGTVAKIVHLPATVRKNAAIVEFHSDIPMALLEMAS